MQFSWILNINNTYIWVVVVFYSKETIKWMHALLSIKVNKNGPIINVLSDGQGTWKF